jgi:hypothetical protein
VLYAQYICLTDAHNVCRLSFVDIFPGVLHTRWTKED